MEAQLPLIRLDEFAFDEMNLVEIPFCLLQSKKSNLKTIELSPTGHEYLQAASAQQLPTALAEPIVLGLMWLTFERNQFQNRRVVFSLRELVEEYMYPGEFSRYRAGGKLLKSVEEEMHRIAATRIRSDRWFDRRLGKHVEIDAAIIDSIAILKAGGKNSPRVIEVIWGTKIADSVRARYTKGINAKLFLQIRQPIDRRLYRWLDRQLPDGEDALKKVQRIRSTYDFARYKLLMTGSVLEKRGRTASSYIVTKLKQSLERLNGLGFAIRMDVDKSEPDFSLRFERIHGEKNEIVETDPSGDLVHEFLHLFHDVPRDAKRRGLRARDREAAQRWIDAYGLEKALLMLEPAKRLHALNRKRSNEPIYYFAGLETYEAAADGIFERERMTQQGQLKLVLAEDRKEKWEAYRREQLARAEAALTLEDRERLTKKAEEAARAQVGAGINIPGVAKRIAEAELKRLILEDAGIMTEDAFSMVFQAK